MNCGVLKDFHADFDKNHNELAMPSVNHILQHTKLVPTVDLETITSIIKLVYKTDDMQCTAKWVNDVDFYSDKYAQHWIKKQFAYMIQNACRNGYTSLSVKKIISNAIPTIGRIMTNIEIVPTISLETMESCKKLIYDEDGIYLDFYWYEKDKSKYDDTKAIQNTKLMFAKKIQNKYKEQNDKDDKERNDNMPFRNNSYNAFLNAYMSVGNEKIKKDIRDVTNKIDDLKTAMCIPAIEKYKIYNNKVLVVWFIDGTFTKAVVGKDEEFDLYTGLMVCLFKRLLGKDGHKDFNNIMRKAVKQLKDIDKDNEKKADEAKKEAEKKRHKAEMKRKAKALKRKEEAIDIQKQGFIRAMQEMGEDDRK